MRLSYTKALAVATSLLILGACTEEFRQEVKKAPSMPTAAFVPGEVLIQLKSGGTSGSRMATSVLEEIQGELVENLVTPAMRSTAARSGGEAKTLILAKSGLGTMEAIAKLQGHPEVQFAEPNWIYHHFGGSNDPYYTNGSLWGMYGDATTPANQFGCQSGEAASNNCSSVWVGIIDEGYMYTHEDLAANAGTNPGEIAGNGIDDDGNGYADDVYGWDFAGGNNTVFDGGADDHGTHVAGTIGGVGNNGKGVAGVCWSVKLMNAKFLGNNGGTTANAVKAVDYFTDLKARHGLNLIATSNSWGGGGFSQTLQDAISRANNAGILFIAAAGNSTLNCESSNCYPAEYPNDNVIAVASITNTGALSGFSNYGSSTIDIGAPGSSIWSTVPTKSGKSSYSSYSGTSMATPHVSGAAALYKARNPSATAAQVKAAILNSATPTASLSGKCVTGGRLNVSGF